MTLTFEQRKHNVFVGLTVIFIANALLAEIIGVKIFSFEQLVGWAPAQIPLVGGLKLDINLSAGVVLWPIVFILTDVVNEYFGRAGVRRITFLSVGAIIYGFLIIYIVTGLPPAGFWVENNTVDLGGNPYNINTAFSSIFTQGMNIIFASLTTFLVSQFLDATLFHHFRRITGNKLIWLRATGSTFISQLVDSFLILFLAFYVLGNWSFQQVISVGIIQYIYKITAAVVLTPLIYLAHSVIDRYLGEKEAVETAQGAH
ncbi:MAG: queuosine precursor transporter [Sphingobacteriales bacterium]|nr:MAG: queuosine precursor transporter [Sphingobacteriales bacterium]